MDQLKIKNYDSGNQPTDKDQTWTTEQLGEDFEVISFMAPYILVRRKSDGKDGMLEFTHNPRVYFGWSER